MLFEKWSLMLFNVPWAWILEQCNTWQRQCFLNLELFRRLKWEGLHCLTLPWLELVNQALFQVRTMTLLYQGVVSVCNPPYPSVSLQSISGESSRHRQCPALDSFKIRLCPCLMWVSLDGPSCLWKYRNCHEIFPIFLMLLMLLLLVEYKILAKCCPIWKVHQSISGKRVGREGQVGNKLKDHERLSFSSWRCGVSFFVVTGV